MPKNNKLYFGVSCTDYLYCVPARDVKTAGDAGSIKVNDPVTFAYGSTDSTGTVFCVSSKEADVMAEIHKLKKQKKKKEASFHEERPRPSAMRQRDLMKSLSFGKEQKQVLMSNDEDSKGSAMKKVKIKKEKKIKEENKARAQMQTEQHLLSAPSCSNRAIDHSNSKGNEVQDSSSDYDAKNDCDSNALVHDHSDSDSSVEKSSTKNNSHKKLQDIQNLKRLDLKESEDELSDSAKTSDGDANDGSHLPVHDVSTKEDLRDAENVEEMKLCNMDNGADFPMNQNHSKINGDLTSCSNEMKRESRKRLVSPSSNRGKKHKKTKRSRAYSSSSSFSSSSSSSSKSSSSSSSSSSSVSSSDSSSSSDDSDSSLSSDSSVKKHRKKRKHRKSSRGHKKSKKSKRKSKKHRKKKYSRKITVKRNWDIFPGENYKWKATDEDVEEVHSNFPIYVKKSIMADALQKKSPQTFIHFLVSQVYTEEALRGSTAQGFPARNIGKKKLKNAETLPRLDPTGREAILKRAEELENERKSWRPRIGKTAMSHAFSQAVGKF